MGGEYTHAHYTSTTLIHTPLYKYVHKYIHVLKRDEKEGRKKEARSNKQGKATQHTQGSHFS